MPNGLLANGTSREVATSITEPEGARVKEKEANESKLSEFGRD